MTTAGYALGGIFWASLLAGTVLFEICRRNLSGDAGYREWKQKKVPGIFGFFRTKAARIAKQNVRGQHAHRTDQKSRFPAEGHAR